MLTLRTLTGFPRRGLGCVLAAATLAVGLAAPPAAGQINYNEGPDLSANFNAPTPVGTLAAGLNRVFGTLSSTWIMPGIEQGDPSDAFSFIVPPGLAVTKIEVVITNYLCTNCTSRVRTSGPGLSGGSITGNSTLTLPISGVLMAGTYSIDASSIGNQSGPAVPGSGSFSYQFRITAVPTSYDSCEFAALIGLGSTPFDTTTATTDGPPTVGCAGLDGAGLNSDLWHLFIPTASGVLTVDTCGSTFDTGLAVYTGVCGSLTQVACNDDNGVCGSTFPGNRNSQVAITVTAGQTYRIRFGGYQNSAGTGTLTLAFSTSGACCNRSTGGCLVLPQADCQTFGGTFLGFASTCSPGTCVACPADFNGTDGVNPQDIFDFLNAWFAGC